MNDNDDLLRPSLSGTSTHSTAIYSATTGYIAAFLGGPVAAAGIALTNSVRMRRLTRDWPLALLALALLYVMLWWEIREGGNEWLRRYLGPSGPSALRSVVSLLFFCGIYLLHYRSYRSMRVLGLKAPSGWGPGIAAIIVGYAVTDAFTSILKS